MQHVIQSLFTHPCGWMTRWIRHKLHVCTMLFEYGSFSSLPRCCRTIALPPTRAHLDLSSSALHSLERYPEDFETGNSAYSQSTVVLSTYSNNVSAMENFFESHKIDSEALPLRFHDSTDTKGFRSEHRCFFGPECEHNRAFRASRGDSTPECQFYLRRWGTYPGGNIWFFIGRAIRFILHILGCRFSYWPCQWAINSSFQWQLLCSEL